jgi:hypothetical protein
MGAIVIRNIVFIILISFAFVSCSVLQNGYTNEYGQYVPKIPRFKLKDKQGVFPELLDTTCVYRMVEMYLNGQKEDLNLNKTNELYLKFYSKGRYIKFTVSVIDNFGNSNSINQNDLNPEKAIKGYYYSPNGKDIQIESFVYGDGQGHYVISHYTLDNSGDTLIMQGKYLKIIYKKETIPTNWNRYKIDW